MRSIKEDFALSGKAIGLPSGFFALEEGSKGGGVIEVSIDTNCPYNLKV